MLVPYQDLQLKFLCKASITVLQNVIETIDTSSSGVIWNQVAV